MLARKIRRLKSVVRNDAPYCHSGGYFRWMTKRKQRTTIAAAGVAAVESCSASERIAKSAARGKSDDLHAAKRATRQKLSRKSASQQDSPSPSAATVESVNIDDIFAKARTKRQESRSSDKVRSDKYRVELYCNTITVVLTKLTD